MGCFWSPDVPEALAHLGPPACTAHTEAAAHCPPDPGGPLPQGALLALSPHHQGGPKYTSSPEPFPPAMLLLLPWSCAVCVPCEAVSSAEMVSDHWSLITDHLHPLQGLVPCSSSKSISVGEWIGGAEPRMAVKSGLHETCDSENKSTEL